MALPRVLILGAGFGGLAAATTLRRAAGDRVDLLVVDAVPAFMMGLRKLWLLDGRGTRAEGTRDRRTLPARAIPYRQGKGDASDPARGWGAGGRGRPPSGYLVVGPGGGPRGAAPPLRSRSSLPSRCRTRWPDRRCVRRWKGRWPRGGSASGRRRRSNGSK